MDFQIRPSRPEDFEALWRMDQACFPPEQAYSRSELSFYIKRKGSFTLVAQALMPPTIIGFVVGESTAHDQGHIITIDVLLHSRRVGVGSSLLEEAERRLQAAACRSIFLETAVDNRAALLFYKRHGYTVDKTIPRYYNGSLDAFLMRKDLLRAASAG